MLLFLISAAFLLIFATAFFFPLPAFFFAQDPNNSGLVPGYPYPMTTSAWPETALAAHPNTDQSMRKAVAEALFRCATCSLLSSPCDSVTGPGHVIQLLVLSYCTLSIPECMRATVFTVHASLRHAGWLLICLILEKPFVFAMTNCMTSCLTTAFSGALTLFIYVPVRLFIISL